MFNLGGGKSKGDPMEAASGYNLYPASFAAKSAAQDDGVSIGLT
jgi:hypothetical protein